MAVDNVNEKIINTLQSNERKNKKKTKESKRVVPDILLA